MFWVVIAKYKFNVLDCSLFIKVNYKCQCNADTDNVGIITSIYETWLTTKNNHLDYYFLQYNLPSQSILCFTIRTVGHEKQLWNDLSMKEKNSKRWSHYGRKHPCY